MEKSLLWIVFFSQYASESRARKGKMDCFAALAMTIAHKNEGRGKAASPPYLFPRELQMSSLRATRSNLLLFISRTNQSLLL